jgi:hypothetical protein
VKWEDAFDLSSVRAYELAAVEVYRSAGEVPAEFNRTNSACGVLVLWSNGR